LLEQLRPRRFNRQWRVDQRLRFDEFVDRVRDELHIAGVDGVMEAFERRFVAGCLGC
jgi:hypothetical protein